MVSDAMGTLAAICLGGIVLIPLADLLLLSGFPAAARQVARTALFVPLVLVYFLASALAVSESTSADAGAVDAATLTVGVLDLFLLPLALRSIAASVAALLPRPAEDEAAEAASPVAVP